VLGAEAVVLQLQRLPPGQAEHERERLGRGQVEVGQLEPLPEPSALLARPGRLLDPPPERVDLDPPLAEDGGGQAPLVTEQGQQQVLGADPVMPEPPRLSPGVEHRLLGTPGDPHRRHLPVVSVQHSPAWTPERGGQEPLP
jgi:hypothetical protein